MANEVFNGLLTGLVTEDILRTDDSAPMVDPLEAYYLLVSQELGEQAVGSLLSPPGPGARD